MTAPRSLVLGGSVFIGRHLVRRLLADGHDVTVLHRGSRAAPADVESLHADRGDAAAMRRALAGRTFDTVYDISGSVQVVSAGLIGELIADLDGHCGRYLFVSSVAAYGIGDGRFPWTEDRPLSSARHTGYGGHKAAVERLLAARCAETGFPYTVIRPAAVYGPHDNIPDGEIAMFLRLRERRPVLLPHDGLVCVSYGHVDDLARALVIAGTHPQAAGEVFNITADTVTSRYYVDTIARIVGVEPDIVTIPDHELADIGRPLPFNHRFQKVMHSMLGIDKARRVLGFEPAYDFERGHRATYEWFLAAGLDRLEEPLTDPVWNMSWDFAREAAVAARIRERGAGTGD